MKFPEIYRSACAEVKFKKSTLSIFTIQAVCLTIFIAVSQKDSDTYRELFYTFFGLQTAVFVLAGAQRLLQCISEERLERTWDFQRLTPQTSFDLCFGKWVGALLFPAILYFSFVPWVFTSLFLSGHDHFSTHLKLIVQSLGMIFFIFNLCLLLSSNAEKKIGAGILGFVLIYFGLIAISNAFRKDALLELKWMSFSMSVITFAAFVSIFFGVWAFLAARWRVGRDLMEDRRLWRLPSFLILNTLFFMATDTADTDRSIWIGIGFGISLVVGILMSLGNSERLSEWRMWLKFRTGADQLHSTPYWIQFVATIIPLGWIFYSLGLGDGLQGILLVFPLFILRDLLFLQICRFTASRQPEVMAVIYISLAYALPGILLAAFHRMDLYFLFGPVMEGNATLVMRLMPPIVQSAICAIILLRAMSFRREPSSVQASGKFVSGNQ